MSILGNIGLDKKTIIKEWIENNFKIENGAIDISLDFNVNIRGSSFGYQTDAAHCHVTITNHDLTSLNDNGLFIWQEINGSFNISNSKIKSLKGAPRKVNGTFNCSNCNDLTSLEGAPIVVNSFECSYCKNLTTLKGAPQKCDYFYCASCENLYSLFGGPRVVEYTFYCSECPKLVSLSGAPTSCGSFEASSCGIQNLDFAPLEVNGSFNISNCPNITSLKGLEQLNIRAPYNKEEKYNETTDSITFMCPGCKNLTTLEGLNPKMKISILDCNSCPSLISLKGCPQTSPYFKELYCYNCDSLISLHGAPMYINHIFDCHGCKNLGSLSGVPIINACFTSLKSTKHAFLSRPTWPEVETYNENYSDLYWSAEHNNYRLEQTMNDPNIKLTFCCHSCKRPWRARELYDNLQLYNSQAHNNVFR